MIIRIDYDNGRHEFCYDVLSFRVENVIDPNGVESLCLIVNYENHSTQYKYVVEYISNIFIYTKGGAK